jgi:hypothetical protein
MDIEPPLESDPQLSEANKPCVRSLDNQTVFAKPLATFNAAPCDPTWDAFSPQVGLAAAIVIALSACNLLGRWRGRPTRPLSVGLRQCRVRTVLSLAGWGRRA